MVAYLLWIGYIPEKQGWLYILHAATHTSTYKTHYNLVLYQNMYSSNEFWCVEWGEGEGSLFLLPLHTARWSHLFTYSMVQSPWEANWFAASQEIPSISWNPKVHYRTHKRPPPVTILGQPSPLHIPTSHLLEIHPIIIHLSTPRSPQWSPSISIGGGVSSFDYWQPRCAHQR